MDKKILIALTLFISILMVSCDKNMSGDSEGMFESLSGDMTGTPSDDPNGNGQIEPGTITAGEWNDLDNWQFWKDLMNENSWNQYQDYWLFYTNKRYSVKVVNQDNRAVVNAKLTLKDNQGNSIWEARTDNTGTAELWGDLYGPDNEANSILLSYNGIDDLLNPIYLFEDNINNFELNTEVTIPSNSNIQFVVDATGSMGDEIEYLKIELGDVINTIQNQFTNMNISLGITFYRDENDSYLVDNLPFTTNIPDALSFVENHSAGGGGDYPEAVHSALESAINEQWEDDAISRILFLVLDAPPHHENDVIESIQASVKEATAKGIKIIPVTASGIDKETEFLMRFMAISTNGTYCFITNDSGIGNDHIEATVGEYDVEFLNDLIIRLISENSEY